MICSACNQETVILVAGQCVRCYNTRVAAEAGKTPASQKSAHYFNNLLADIQKGSWKKIEGYDNKPDFSPEVLEAERIIKERGTK